MSKFIKIKNKDLCVYASASGIDTVEVSEVVMSIYFRDGVFVKIIKPTFLQLDCLIPRDLSEQIADAELITMRFK